MEFYGQVIGIVMGVETSRHRCRNEADGWPPDEVNLFLYGQGEPILVFDWPHGFKEMLRVQSNKVMIRGWFEVEGIDSLQTPRIRRIVVESMEVVEESRWGEPSWWQEIRYAGRVLSACEVEQNGKALGTKKGG